MEKETKQRIIGIMVLSAIIAICLPLIFYHPLPGINKQFLSANTPSPPDTPTYTYDIPLAGEKVTRSSDKRVVGDIDSTNSIEVSAGAKAIPSISAQILRINSRTIKESDSKQCVSSCTDGKANMNHKVSNQLSFSGTESGLQRASQEKNHIPQTYVKNMTLADASNSTRDSKPNKLLLQSDLMRTPDAWVVQIASFSDRNRAIQFLNRLRKKNFSVFARKTENFRGRKITRVFIGPYIKQEQALQLQQQLKKDMNLKGVIKKYTL